MPASRQGVATAGPRHEYARSAATHGIAVHRESEWAERGEITLEAVAQIMDVSVMTALRMVRLGIIKGRQVCRGAPWVIKAEDVAAYRAQECLAAPANSQSCSADL